jgi:endonuclease G
MAAVGMVSCDSCTAKLQQAKRALAEFDSYEVTADKAAATHYPNLLQVRIEDATIPSQVKEYEGFTLSFNSDNHTPNWVAWQLLGSETDGAAARSNKFWQDNDIEGCPNTKDYTKSGYDRGHLSPAADNKSSEARMNDCFVMANMCPQTHSLNDGAWKTLETKERLWAQRDSCIIIVAGPIYTKTDKERIGDIGVRVPSAFYKVIIAPYLPSPRGIGFIYPNMTSPGNMQNYSMTIDEVERITGLDFFYALPDDLENEIESKASFKEWNKN